MLTKDQTLDISVQGLSETQVIALIKGLEIGLTYGRAGTVDPRAIGSIKNLMASNDNSSAKSGTDPKTKSQKTVGPSSKGSVVDSETESPA